MCYLLVNVEVRAENVTCDNEVVLDTVNGKPVHAQILRQQRVAVTLHHKLKVGQHFRCQFYGFYKHGPNGGMCCEPLRVLPLK